MRPSGKLPRFRTNPVELLVFLAVCGLSAYSARNLVYDDSPNYFAALTPMTSNPISEGKAPTPAPAKFAAVEYSCEVDFSASVLGGKVRISGPLCAGTPASGRHPASIGRDSKIVKAQIVNLTNSHTSSLYLDREAFKFSSDLIPLEPGANSLRIEFVVENQSPILLGLTLHRDPSKP